MTYDVAYVHKDLEDLGTLLKSYAANGWRLHTIVLDVDAKHYTVVFEKP